MILITGGARSGKSRLAEQKAQAAGGAVMYIATSLATDDEMRARIALHQQQRPAGWTSVEAYRDLGQIVQKAGNSFNIIIIECVTTLVTNLMFDLAPGLPAESMDFEAIEQHVNQQISELLAAAQQSPAALIIVTNEVGMGIVPDNALARHFRDIAGRVNQQLAAVAREVYLVVSGIPVQIKSPV